MIKNFIFSLDLASVTKTGLVLILVIGFATTTFGQKKAEKQKIEQLVHAFSEAASEADVTTMDKLLHPEFRVVINQFMGSPEVTIMNKTAYLEGMKVGKIGGKPHTLKVESVEVNGHTAVAKAQMSSEAMTMNIHFSVVQNPEGEWSLIEDFPFVVPN